MSIRIRGARTHNLKNIHLDLPRNQMIAITGISGSGKSSLAFDTLYAEGQRRYVESLSAYARQFLQLMEKPDVDAIEGLSPAIAIDQKSANHNPRSTVATITEIHDYLRLLFARAGTPYCPTHPEQVLQSTSIVQLVDLLLALPQGTKLIILAPIELKLSLTQTLQALQCQGYARVRLDDKILMLEDLENMKKHASRLEVVIDRFSVVPDQRQRLFDSLERAFQLGTGKLLIQNLDTNTEQSYSNQPRCPQCDWCAPTLDPRLFSFNSPLGACPECNGLGVQEDFDIKKIVPFPSLSLQRGAISGWDERNRSAYKSLQKLASALHFSLTSSWDDLSEQVRYTVLNGDPDKQFEGVLNVLKRRWSQTKDSPLLREHLAHLRTRKVCTSCHGERLGALGRNVRIQTKTLPALEALSISEALSWITTLQLTVEQLLIAKRLLHEIQSRLQFLSDVGLKYLTLDRAAHTLSGGETQRIRLASQIGAGLSGVMYVLDEPSIGLHAEDNHKLLQALLQLRKLDNTLILVEHDEETMRHADYLVELGPGAGNYGGEVIAAGSPEVFMQQKHSSTAQYLTLSKSIPIPKLRRKPKQWLKIFGAHGNNLRHIAAAFPLGLLTCVSGVSGSGKSTLVNDCLASLALQTLNKAHTQPSPYQRVEGLDALDKVVVVDQSSIGRTPRSNPATYTGLFTPIRELFAQLPSAKERGFDSGRFSFNIAGGRCENCMGDGVKRVEMLFLPDVFVSCETCNGKRYNAQTLEILYKGKNIAQVLDMTVNDAVLFFEHQPHIARKLKTLEQVGLGYLKLGQSATTLSGGEAQRVKLALELSKRDTGKTLYILDEPTTGLHFDDVAMLLKVLHALCNAGNTVIVIEHHIDVLINADWLIDLGPGGGDQGGAIVCAGDPETVAQSSQSRTAPYLKTALAKHKPLRLSA